MANLVFGSSGLLGSEIASLLEANGLRTLRMSRNKNIKSVVFLDPDQHWLDEMKEKLGSKSIDSVVFAQGLNLNDDIESCGNLMEVFEANVAFIVQNLHLLLSQDMLDDSARIVLISSIWQELSRKNKLSYSISKSALRGLVNSLVADLSGRGLRINAVLPGVVDGPMTRKNLSSSQIREIENQTPSKILVTPADVAKAVLWLCSPQSSGVNGQFIKVDNGWSNVRHI